MTVSLAPTELSCSAHTTHLTLARCTHSPWLAIPSQDKSSSLSSLALCTFMTLWLGHPFLNPLCGRFKSYLSIVTSGKPSLPALSKTYLPFVLLSECPHICFTTFITTISGSSLSPSFVLFDLILNKAKQVSSRHRPSCSCSRDHSQSPEQFLA